MKQVYCYFAQVYCYFAQKMTKFTTCSTVHVHGWLSLVYLKVIYRHVLYIVHVQ